MSETNIIVEKIYKFSENNKFIEAEEYIDNTFDFLAIIGKYSIIDSVLYNLNLNMVSIKIVKDILYKISHLNDKLIMIKDFESRAINQFGKGRF